MESLSIRGHAQDWTGLDGLDSTWLLQQIPVNACNKYRLPPIVVFGLILVLLGKEKADSATRGGGKEHVIDDPFLSFFLSVIYLLNVLHFRSFKLGTVEGLSHMILHHKRNQSTKYKVQRKPFQHHHPSSSSKNTRISSNKSIQLNQSLEWVCSKL